MAASVSDLEQRQIERWRAEIGEALAAELAYPPFFEFRTGRELVRPMDRAKRDELEQFVRSINFVTLERTDVSSAEIRRFLERLLLRYLEVNPALRHPWVVRRLPSLRARVPRLAGQIHRDLLAYLSGSAPGFGARRPQQSWAYGRAKEPPANEETEHNTRVLEAVLGPSEAGYAPPPTAPPQHSPAPASGQRQPPAAAPHSMWSGAGANTTVPAPPSRAGLGAPAQSPFATLAAGAQSPMFGIAGGITDTPTGPLIGIPAGSAEGHGPVPGGPPQAGVRPLSEDLYQLYGDYLRDMQPEAFGNGRPASPEPPPPPTQPLPTPKSDRWTPGPRLTQPPTPPPARPVTSPPLPLAGAIPLPNALPASPQGDLLIFFQLRYQLEAYVRRAARSYGVQTRSDDPSGVLDALRRTGYVDEADLRLAEGILALTDRVTASGAATLEDYRQALMLYLLYHRSHLSG